MKINIRKREFQLWGMLTIAIVVVWLIVISMLFASQNNNKKAFLDVELKRFEGEVNSTLITYESFSNYIFEQIDQDEEIISTIYQANSASVEEKEILREKLYDKLYNQYTSMKHYEFRQFHFHLANTESFLRMHSPYKYGDILANVRESVRLVNEKKINVKGFEEGRIFNGFRYVYPLQYNDNHIGSVELSISSASIIEVLSKIYDYEDFYFIIDKSVVEENVFNDETANYRDSLFFDDYYVDKEVDEITSAYNKVVPASKELFFQGIKEQCMEKIKDKKSFVSIYDYEGKDYIVKFSSIYNLKETPIAYLISISESVVYKQFSKDMYREIILVTLLAFFIIIFGLILAFYQYKLKNSSELDFLTKIYNRNKFYEIVEREVRLAKRNRYDSAVMLMDIDHFKSINDTYGHEWGDEVLKELVNQIMENIRDVDVFARWGGEEFVLLLPNTKKDDALQVAEKIRVLIDKCDSPQLKGVTISIGVTLIDPDNYNIDNSIKVADEAMYCAKESGRNQVCFK